MSTSTSDASKIVEVRNRYTGEVLACEVLASDTTGQSRTLREVVEVAVRSGAYLAGADLTRVDLSDARLTGADLTGADLTGADLADADLYGANLTGADLTGADLTGADLTGADLTGADLTGADLTGADLTGADLTGADLSGARLAGADLTYADLTYADLTYADLTGADLTGADLTGAIDVDASSSLSPAERRERRLARISSYRAAHPDVPVIEHLDVRILAVIDGSDAAPAVGSLEMSTWHTCETTHCLGGWAVELAGERGRRLERELGGVGRGTQLAAIQIYLASTGRVPNFFVDNERALADLRVRAVECRR